MCLIGPISQGNLLIEEKPFHRYLRSLMKVCAALLIVLALVAGFYTHQNEGRTLWDETEVSAAPEIQKSSRRPRAGGGANHGGSQKTSLAELRARWQALLPSHGESLFDELEMARFLKTLTLRETRMLATALVEDQPANKDAAYRVFTRWGELDGLGALAFIDDQGRENSSFRQYLRHYLFVGWAKTDAKAALDNANLDNLRNPYSSVWDSNASMRAGIMGSMVHSDPQSALRVLAENPRGLTGDGFINRILSTPVFLGLPEGSNWASIANEFRNQPFIHIPDMFDTNPEVVTETGPGEALFSRWATEAPDEAITWFNNRASDYEGTLSGGPAAIADLVGGWYQRDPEAASTWIEAEIAQPKHGNIETILEANIRRDFSNSRWVSWGQHLSEESTRHEILRSVTENRSTTEDPFAIPGDDATRAISPKHVNEIEQLLTQFNLTPAHEQEIREILNQRESDR